MVEHVTKTFKSPLEIALENQASAVPSEEQRKRTIVKKLHEERDQNDDEERKRQAEIQRQ